MSDGAPTLFPTASEWLSIVMEAAVFVVFAFLIGAALGAPLRGALFGLELHIARVALIGIPLRWYIVRKKRQRTEPVPVCDFCRCAAEYCHHVHACEEHKHKAFEGTPKRMDD